MHTSAIKMGAARVGHAFAHVPWLTTRALAILENKIDTCGSLAQVCEPTNRKRSLPLSRYGLWIEAVLTTLPSIFGFISQARSRPKASAADTSNFKHASLERNTMTSQRLEC